FFGCRERTVHREKIIMLATKLGEHQHSKEEVRSLARESNFQDLTLHEDSPTQWSIEAPSEFGAKNWVLYVEFKDSRLAALRVRTADSKNERPKSAPQDKVF